MKNSKLIAALLSGAIVLWMVAGLVFDSNESESSSDKPVDKSGQREIVVEIREQTAQPIISYIDTQGSIEPNRAATIRAETTGRVTRIERREGAAVTASDVVLTLAMGDRQARLAEAEAEVADAKRKYESARNLGEMGYSPESRTDETLAALRSAQADAAAVRLEIEHTRVRAPFDGVVDTLHVETGEYANVGSEVATIVDNDPLVARVSVPQGDVASLETGDSVALALATGHEVTGTIRFIAPRAQTATRTFRVEIEFANPGGVPSGISAKTRIPKRKTLAQRVSPAVLTLDEQGNTGIKTIGPDGAVVFHEVEIVRAEPGSIYVSGLPETARIITAGQGFVTAGDKVAFVPSGEPSAVADVERSRVLEPAAESRWTP